MDRNCAAKKQVYVSPLTPFRETKYLSSNHTMLGK